MNYSPGKFDTVIFVCVIHGSADCVSPGYQFVTAGDNIQGIIFRVPISNVSALSAKGHLIR